MLGCPSESMGKTMALDKNIFFKHFIAGFPYKSRIESGRYPFFPYNFKARLKLSTRYPVSKRIYRKALSLYFHELLKKVLVISVSGSYKTS
jgi:hypothetical protein